MSEATVALITGVSTGIGRATAELFAHHGLRTFGTARRPEAVTPIAGVELIPMDVREDASVRTAIERVLSTAGRIDVVVNNAGVSAAGALEETSPEEAKAIFETNFFGVLRVTQAVLPHLRAQGQGRIVNVGSLGSFLAMPYQGIYSSTKHALAAFSQTLDLEVRHLGIRSVLVQPGYIRTEVSRNAALPRHPLPVYDDQRRRTGKLLDERVNGGDDPRRAAEVILRAATSPHPCLKYLAGRGARSIHFAWWLLPAGIFAYGVRRHFGLR